MEIYEGSISSGALTAFEGVVSRSPMSDYVAFRSGQFSYVLAVGDLDLSSGVITGTADLYTYYSYGGDYSWTQTSGALDLTLGDNLVYSNLGSYPILGGDVNATLLLFAFCVFCFTMLTNGIFKAAR